MNTSSPPTQSDLFALLAECEQSPRNTEILSIYADACEDAGATAESLIARLAVELIRRDGRGLYYVVSQVYTCDYGALQQCCGMPDWAPTLPPLAYARQVAKWLDSQRARIRRFLAEEKRLAAAKDAAAAGDPQALLALPNGRAAVAALAAGKKVKYLPAPTSLAPRKAVAAAKAAILARSQRQADAVAGEMARRGEPGRIATIARRRHRTRALAIAREYHESVQSLYQSKRAEVVYGRGGQEAIDYPYAGAWKTRPARWHNAGARLDNEDHPTIVIVENHRGTEVARLAYTKE